MSRTIKFTKMHGAGNDYIYVNTLETPISHPKRSPSSGAIATRA